MWELDYKESWAQKNWCFWTVVLEKTLESLLDLKEIQPVHPKGDQSWVFIGRTDAEAETPVLWPPDAKNWLTGKDPDVGKIEGGKRRGRQRMRWLMASPTQWTWVWASSRSWWWTGRPGVLQSMGLQRVRHDWATELNWTEGDLLRPWPCDSSQGLEGREAARDASHTSCWETSLNTWAGLSAPSCLSHSARVRGEASVSGFYRAFSTRLQDLGQRARDVICGIYIVWASLVTQPVKNPPANAGHVRDTGSGWIPGLGRSPGGGHGNLLQYPGLENPMDRGAWRATVRGIAELDMTVSLTHLAHTSVAPSSPHSVGRRGVPRPQPDSPRLLGEPRAYEQPEKSTPQAQLPW